MNVSAFTSCIKTADLSRSATLNPKGVVFPADKPVRLLISCNSDKDSAVQTVVHDFCCLHQRVLFSQNRVLLCCSTEQNSWTCNDGWDSRLSFGHKNIWGHTLSATAVLGMIGKPGARVYYIYSAWTRLWIVLSICRQRWTRCPLH